MIMDGADLDKLVKEIDGYFLCVLCMKKFYDAITLKSHYINKHIPTELEKMLR